MQIVRLLGLNANLSGNERRKHMKLYSCACQGDNIKTFFWTVHQVKCLSKFLKEIECIEIKYISNGFCHV